MARQPAAHARDLRPDAAELCERAAHAARAETHHRRSRRARRGHGDALGDRPAAAGAPDRDRRPPASRAVRGGRRPERDQPHRRRRRNRAWALWPGASREREVRGRARAHPQRGRLALHVGARRRRLDRRRHPTDADGSAPRPAAADPAPAAGVRDPAARRHALVVAALQQALAGERRQAAPRRPLFRSHPARGRSEGGAAVRPRRRDHRAPRRRA